MPVPARDPETGGDSSAAESEPETSNDSRADETALSASSEDPSGDGKTKQTATASATSGPDVDVEKSSSPAESKGEGTPGSENPESDSSELNNVINGDAIRERKDDEFGIIDSVYYRLFYLRHFRFDDISVQIDENMLLIEAKHKTYTDEHGFSTRTYIRKHYLPDYVITDQLTSYFTGDGVLIIQAPCTKIM